LPETQKIGFVGVGRMGAAMALRLHDVGYPIVAVFDTHAPFAQATADATGAAAVSTPREVAERADWIVTVVSDDAATRAIFADDSRSLLAAAANKIFINCATVTPTLHAEIQAIVEERGGLTLEACLASSIPQARSGELYLMVAGREHVFKTVQPMLESMSKSLRFVGPAGQAARVKALVNMVMNINTAGLAEGLGIGDALGLDVAMLREVFSQTGANSRVLETDGEDMQNRDHAVYFSAAHAAKDSHIALELARGVGIAAPVAAASAQQYDTMIERGLGDLDKSGISELTFLSRQAPA
jgi:3-hydroxyisobutyrate dehydrogenase